MPLKGYRLGAMLAQTPTTVVFRAQRSHDNAPVIVKMPAQELVSAKDRLRLEFECRLLSKLSGPGIVSVLGLELAEMRPALVLEDFGASSSTRLYYSQ